MSRTTTGATYPTINTVGALLPPDLLTRLANGELDHLTPNTYGLPETFTLRQAAARAWELLLPTYRSFQTRLATLPDGDPATTVTRDRWTSILLRELGYDLENVPNIHIDGDTFDVRHLDGHVPIHMLGWNVDLDKRAATNIRGASRTAPHSLIQELLNRTDKHLWAILTNGQRLRLLRDNIVMGRPAYIEFDLEGMFTGEQFADFAILYALAHATRLRSDQPADCILEAWRNTAINDGTRALEHLRDGVVEALKALGTGFLEHPDNTDLRDLLKDNHGATEDYYRWLLRLVYRLIFLFVAEDRDLLHPEDTPRDIRQRYADYFSTQHLRELATRRRAGRHTDAWVALRLVFRALGNDGEPSLGLPAFGSDLFNPGFIGTLDEASLSNERLLGAVRSLSQLPDRATGTLRPVDYKNLGSEELGSVYEALLEYVPTVANDGQTFGLGVMSGNARKTSGSYYTPSELVELLLDETLDPILDKAVASAHPVEALLAITVCDPACGSGHFLVAAARRIARRLAAVRTGDPEPTPDAMREALRDVVARCIYGVDLSDLAAELAKVSLWLESLTPGQPLAFLDAHIKVGNALIGTTPTLLAQNIPDTAFQPLEGDDDPCEVCASKGITARITAREAKRGETGCSHTPWSTIVRNANKSQRQAAEAQQGTLMGMQQVYVSNAAFASAAEAIEQYDPTDITSVRAQADAWQRAEQEPALQRAKEVADAWCAAFLWPLTQEHARSAPTHEVLLTLQDNPDLSPLRQTRDGIARLARRYRFFHWHLEFPHLFTVDAALDTPTGWRGGFSCIVGNPPWERLTFEDDKYFASRAPRVLEATTTDARKTLIEELRDTDPTLHSAYREAKRDAECYAHFATTSGRFPRGSAGRTNTFGLFGEMGADAAEAGSSVGLIVQTALFTDTPFSAFVKRLVSLDLIRNLYDFENSQPIFTGVHRSLRFAMVVMRGRLHTEPEGFDCGFLLRRIAEVKARHYRMTPADVEAISPQTGLLPVCATEQEFSVLREAYGNFPTVTSKERRCWMKAGVGVTSQQFSKDYVPIAASGVGGQADLVGLWESKMMHQHDHRFATYEGVDVKSVNDGKPRTVTTDQKAGGEARPRFALPIAIANSFRATKGLRQDWFVGYRDVTRATDTRTAIAAIVPSAIPVQPLNLVHVPDAFAALWAVAGINSLPYDYLARQRISGIHLNVTTFDQLPLPDATDADLDCVVPLALELAYTSESLRPLAEQVGHYGPPYTFNEDRREDLRHELDVFFAKKYGFDTSQVRLMMSTFSSLWADEVRRHGEFRTANRLLAALGDPSPM